MRARSCTCVHARAYTRMCARVTACAYTQLCTRVHAQCTHTRVRASAFTHSYTRLNEYIHAHWPASRSRSKNDLKPTKNSLKCFPIRTLVIYQQRYFDAICAIEGESSSSFDEHTELTENVDVDAKDVELHQLLAQSFFKLWNQHI